MYLLFKVLCWAWLFKFIVVLSFRPNDTAELMEEAAKVALCSNLLTSMESTDVLLKTSPMSKSEENTSFTHPVVVSEQQLEIKVQDNEQPDIKVNSGIERNNPSFCWQDCFCKPKSINEWKV